MSDPRYPIGLFEHSGPISEDDLALWIDQIAALPKQMQEAANGLTAEQLDTTYRDADGHSGKSSTTSATATSMRISDSSGRSPRTSRASRHTTNSVGRSLSTTM